MQIEDKVYYSGKVRPCEVDSQGIVHNTAYQQWAECARFDFMKDIGLDVYKLGNAGVDLVIRSTFADYKKALLADDTYEVTTNIKVTSPVKFEMVSNIYSGGKLCVVVSIVACPIDRVTKRPNKTFVKENLSSY